MNASALLSELAELGVLVSRDGDDLLLDAPEDAITDDLVRHLQTRKTDIVALFRVEDNRKVARLIQDRGYVPVRIGSLDNEVLIFVRDESVRVPERWRNAVTYTLDELARLRNTDVEALRTINDVKSVFGGRVVETIDN